MIAALKEGVRLCFDWTIDDEADCLNLVIGYRCRTPPTSHYGVDARSGKYGEPVHERTTEEDVTRKQGKRNPLDPVFPLVGRRIKG
jgi:hypothetical protein